MVYVKILNKTRLAMMFAIPYKSLIDSLLRRRTHLFKVSSRLTPPRYYAHHENNL